MCRAVLVTRARASFTPSHHRLLSDLHSWRGGWMAHGGGVVLLAQAE